MKKITCVLFLTLLLIGMAYTRYIGIVYFSILALTYLLSHRSKMESMLFGIAAAVYLAAISYWLYDNYLVTGHLSGVERSPSTTSIAEILRLILSAASVSVPENPPVIITLAVVAACLAYALNRAPRPPVVVQRNGDLQIVAIIAIPCTAYLLAMVILSRTSQFDPMDIRLLSPVFPAIFLLASILCLRTRRSGTLFMPVGALACFLILSLSFEGYGTFVSSLRNWHEHGKPLQRNSSNSTYNNFTMGNNNVNRQVFTALVEPGGVLVIKQAALQAFLTGLRCIEKPQALDAVSIAKMNTLPAGSLLVVSKSNKPALDALLADLETKGRYIDLDTLVAVKLPIKSR